MVFPTINYLTIKWMYACFKFECKQGVYLDVGAKCPNKRALRKLELCTIGQRCKAPACFA